MEHHRRWARLALYPAIATLATAALLSQPLTSAAATLVKCTVNGTVTYQAEACPAQGPRERPTVEQLNAERKKRLEQAKATAASAPAPASAQAPALPQPAAPPRSAYRCDGRTHCSQMTSCAEAKYFLAHCPNVKMDGNHDGIPCEQQWCH